MTFRTAAAIAAASLALSGAVAAGTPATAAAPTSAPATPGSTSTALPDLTTLAYEVPDCEGCTIRLANVRLPEGADQPVVWQSKAKQVEDGEVRFMVAPRRTWGMSMTIETPWEGQTGYVTSVVQRYRGKAVGDRVSFKQARKAGVASSCWAGTRSDEVRTKVVVRKVMVDGVKKKVPGTLAFTRVTQDWHDPMRRAYGGVLGTQDADICHG
ncbi:hypothetical protein [Nocardioides abyssi]|uniref:Uncharacterized protein n=1 Tax=Nocardioides abyssi TaxID=3058370 RepID=A0ABT8EUJ0_9ACTN|nr:hypothetical protein [Nocardioides abyssi]MDN4161813.1 hypothetical protein [Nocardioides abyssi]